MFIKTAKKQDNKKIDKKKKRISPSVVAAIGTIIIIVGGFFLSYNYVQSKKVMVYDYMNNVFYSSGGDVATKEDEENTVYEYNDIVRLEDRAEISYFLKFLSSEQREAVILRFGEQLSFGEIAKVMGCNM